MAYIRKLSNGSSFRVEVRRNYTFLQAKTFSSESDAKQWAEDFESKLEKILSFKPKKLKKLSPEKVDELGGQDLFHKLGIELNFITFDALANEYMANWSGKDNNQLNRAAYWLKEFRDTPIKAIKTKHIRKAIEKLSKRNTLKTDGSGDRSDKPLSSNTVIRYKVVLSAIFKFAIKKDYLTDNPVNGIDVQAASNIINRYLTEDELSNLMRVCKRSSWEKLHLLVLMAITTGMRKSELTGLRWSDIDFKKNLAKLDDTKNGEPRLNPIPAPAMAELLNFREVGNGLIFHSPTKPDTAFDFTKRWKAALKEAGIENFRFHDLRHTAASYLVMGGATLYEAAEILGHKSTETTKRYAHLSTDHKAKVAERIMGDVFRMPQ
jgi:integrase